MWKYTVIGICFQEKFHHLQEVFGSGVPRDPTSLGCNNNCHDTKASTPCCYHLMPVIKIGVASFSCHAAHRMCEVPEISKGLFLHHIKDSGVRKVFNNANSRNAS